MVMSFPASLGADHHDHRLIADVLVGQRALQLQDDLRHCRQFDRTLRQLGRE
jgi:hypothetical protein